MQGVQIGGRVLTSFTLRSSHKPQVRSLRLLAASEKFLYESREMLPPYNDYAAFGTGKGVQKIKLDFMTYI